MRTKSDDYFGNQSCLEMTTKGPKEPVLDIVFFLRASGVMYPVFLF